MSVPARCFSPLPPSGEIILVTGGGRGIGRLMALDFASKNAIVVIWDKQGVLTASSAMWLAIIASFQEETALRQPKPLSPQVSAPSQNS